MALNERGGPESTKDRILGERQLLKLDVRDAIAKELPKKRVIWPHTRTLAVSLCGRSEPSAVSETKPELTPLLAQHGQVCVTMKER